MATTTPSPVDARISIDGFSWCFGKFLDESTTEIISDDEVICGHVDPEVEGSIPGRELNKFSILLNPTMPFLLQVLPHIGVSGAGSVADPFVSDLSIEPLTIVVDKVGAIHKWTVAWINRIILRGQVGTSPVSIELQCIGKQETEDTFPAGEGDMDYIFGFPGTTLSIGGTSYDLDRYAFIVDRNLVPEWESSNYVTDVGRAPRRSMIATTVPYKVGNDAVYWNNKRSNTPVEIILTITNGFRNIVITLPKSRLVPKSPPIDNVMESVRLPLTWLGQRQISGSHPAFKISVANVP